MEIYINDKNHLRPVKDYNYMEKKGAKPKDYWHKDFHSQLNKTNTIVDGDNKKEEE